MTVSKLIADKLNETDEFYYMNADKKDVYLDGYVTAMSDLFNLSRHEILEELKKRDNDKHDNAVAYAAADLFQMYLGMGEACEWQ